MRQCPKCKLNWITDNQEICKMCEPQILSTNTKSNDITFYDLKLKIGDVIEFNRGERYKATIIGEKAVLFEGKEHTNLTALGRELLKRHGDKHPENLGSWVGVFRYDDQDKNLGYRMERIKKEHNDSND